MIKYILAFCFIVSSLLSSAQSYTIKWGDLDSRSGTLLKIMPFSGEDFYSLRWKGGAVFGGYHIGKHEGLEHVESARVEKSANNSLANFEGVTMLDDHIYVFLSDRKEDRNILLAQQYGYDLKPRGDAVELAEYSLEKGKSRGEFRVVQSRNKKFISVIWNIPGKKDQNDEHGYHVLNTNLESISKGNFELPFDSRLSTISRFHLTDSGDYFLAVKEYEPEEKRRFLKTYLQYKAMHIYHVNGNQLEDYSIELSGKRVEDLWITSDGSELFTVTGVYGENNVEGAKGMFFLKLDYKNQEVLEEGFEEFGKDFITSDWTDTQLRRAERREDRGKGEPTLMDFEMRNVEVLADGSIVGSLEQYYVMVSQSLDSRNVIRTVYTYYYNDIIAFRIQNGEFAWLKKIPKMQVSTNDDGMYSSYAKFVDGNKMCFIFNDNVMNYDDKGNYTDQRLYSAQFSKRRNTVAIVEVDVFTGEVSRKTLFDRSEVGGLAMPKKFVVDYNRNEMILYIFKRYKERYGIIKFDPAITEAD